MRRRRGIIRGQSGADDKRRDEPHPGDKRYQRRNDDGTFGESDDQSRSLGREVRQHSSTKKPENEGDKGD